MGNHFHKSKKNKKIDIDIKNEPDIIFIKNIVEYSYSYGIDNTFIIFKSIYDLLYFVYSKKNSIVFYNLVDYKIINEIKNIGSEFIITFRHYLDKINKRDLVLSILRENKIKIWNVNNFECLNDIKNINTKGFLYSACFLNDNNQIYIITSNNNYHDSEFIKIFDLEGNKIKELNNSNKDTFLVDTYYDNKFSKIYIIAGINYSIISFDYNENQIYHKYEDNSKKGHKSFKIHKNQKEIKIIESSEDGYIRIWNFHSAQLLNRFFVCNDGLFGIYLINDKYLFIGCQDKTLKLIELKNGKIIKNYLEHKNSVLAIEKVNIPEKGEFLLIQDNDHITKLWKIKYNKNK